MELLFEVTNFGKIRNAQITLGDLTLFVGDNNSGKTFLMQLLYGLVVELHELQPENAGIREVSENTLVYGKTWFANLEKQINHYLAQNKEAVVRKIFHRDIPIGGLRLRLTDRTEIYRCVISDFEYDVTDEEEDGVVERGKGRKVKTSLLNGVRGRTAFYTHFRYYPDLDSLKKTMAKRVWRSVMGDGMISTKALFLPASRTGLQLLGKYFFAERDRREYESGLLDFGDEDDETEDAGQENELGLTSPVYDFLQFLTRYNQRSLMFPDNKKLIRFLEEHLIDGRLRETGEEFFYRPEHAGVDVPLYLASSLVNEMAPLIKLLSGRKEYKYIFYDEIETCLHPLKQGEMARLIIRMVNSGRRMVVSTHSDTMAGKLNNLLLLSFSEDSKERIGKKLEKLGLDEEDLLKDRKVHVYQFENHSDGTSLVRELEFRTVPYIGYDFNLFMKNLDNLYEETDIILE